MNPHDRDTRKAEFDKHVGQNGNFGLIYGGSAFRDKMARYAKAYGASDAQVRAILSAGDEDRKLKLFNPDLGNPYQAPNCDSLSELQGFGRPPKPINPWVTILFVLTGLAMLAVAIYLGG